MPDAILDEFLEAGARSAASRLAGRHGVRRCWPCAWHRLAGGPGRLPVAADGSPTPQPSSSSVVASCSDIPPINALSTEYRVFFPCADGAGLGSGPRVGPVMLADEILASAVRDLLTGPNAAERAAGMAAVAPSGSGELLLNVSLQPDGLAVVDRSPSAADAGLEPAFLMLCAPPRSTSRQSRPWSCEWLGDRGSSSHCSAPLAITWPSRSHSAPSAQW